MTRCSHVCRQHTGLGRWESPAIISSIVTHQRVSSLRLLHLPTGIDGGIVHSQLSGRLSIS